ncbi:hypothetical protein SAMN05421788_1093 [Filimonas lacunae]|uniref:Uncharacterized protein n=1 Tax=Filimonas lacunae TaxID=477680 RepID=A0A1N7R3M6_9BACT|nr:hypothetical protein SAMN05421788_1093 [Filimonas lacunae]
MCTYSFLELKFAIEVEKYVGAVVWRGCNFSLLSKMCHNIITLKNVRLYSKYIYVPRSYFGF